MSFPSFIDTHCHLDCLAAALPLRVVLDQSRVAGIDTWVVPGLEPNRWEAQHRLAQIPGVLPAYGVHPLWATSWNDTAARTLRHLAKSAVAVGEIGLDYSDGAPDRSLQRDVFRQQIRIARLSGRPVLIHCRRAFADFLTIARQEGIAEVRGIMHAFSGSLEVARACCALGLAIGVGGAVTFRNARRLPAVVRELGLSHLVLETDAPDLTPEPLRGEVNQPANLTLVAETVAVLCDVSVVEVGRMTTANARQILSLPLGPGEAMLEKK